MEDKCVRTDLWVENAIRVRTFRSDFDGTTDEWKRVFYEVWRWQMTWDFAYEIRVHEMHDGDLCASLLIKSAYKKQCVDMLEEYGYRNIKVENEPVGIVQLYDIEDPAVTGMQTVIVD